MTETIAYNYSFHLENDILGCFASQVAFSIDEEDLSEFEVFFTPYFAEDNA